MSELHGAVMLAQLGRLDGLLEKMRNNQKRIIDQIKDAPGIKVRPRHDEAGDCAICLMFYLLKKLVPSLKLCRLKALLLPAYSTLVSLTGTFTLTGHTLLKRKLLLMFAVLGSVPTTKRRIPSRLNMMLI